MPDLSWITKLIDQKGGVWFALLLGSALIVFGPQFGLSFIDEVDEPYRKWAIVGVVIFGSLSFVRALSAFGTALHFIWRKISERRRRASRIQAVRECLDDLTESEWAILAYLTTRGERHFTTNILGGNATGLVGRGIIRRTVRSGQAVNILQTPYSIDDDVWEILQERRKDFEHSNPNGPPPYDDGW